MKKEEKLIKVFDIIFKIRNVIIWSIVLIGLSFIACMVMNFITAGKFASGIMDYLEPVFIGSVILFGTERGLAFLASMLYENGIKNHEESR